MRHERVLAHPNVTTSTHLLEVDEMATRILAICIICGTSFARKPGTGGKFCASACYHEAQRRGLVARRQPLARNVHTCAHCGKTTVKSVKPGQTLFCCSRDCYDAFRSKVIQDRRADCGHCGRSFALLHTTAKQYKVRFCSDECRKAGRRPPECKCVACGVAFTAIVFRAGFVIRLRGKVCSPECGRDWYRKDPVRKAKISAAFRRDKHPGWQGGSHRAGFRGHDWEEISEAVRKRAGFRCEHCPMTQEEHLRKYGMRLNVNHREPFHQSINKSTANRLSNLEALCKSCHTKADWKWRKANPIQFSMVWK